MQLARSRRDERIASSEIAIIPPQATFPAPHTVSHGRGRPAIGSLPSVLESARLRGVNRIRVANIAIAELSRPKQLVSRQKRFRSALRLVEWIAFARTLAIVTCRQYWTSIGWVSEPNQFGFIAPTVILQTSACSGVSSSGGSGRGTSMPGMIGTTLSDSDDFLPLWRMG
jgi:hypothetical protein